MRIQLKRRNNLTTFILIALIALGVLSALLGSTAVQSNASSIHFEVGAPAVPSNSNTVGTPHAPLACLLPDGDQGIATNALGAPIDCPRNK